MSERNLRSLKHFAGYQFNQSFWNMDEEDRGRAWRAVRDDISGICDHAHMYQIFPSAAGIDFMAWPAIRNQAESSVAEFYRDYARALSRRRDWIRPVRILWGFTGRSTYRKARSAQEIDPFTDEHPSYLVAYPFVKSSDWYMMGRDARQGMTNEHIRLGKGYPQIKQLLLYSFGLQDHEFVVVCEMDDLSLFSELVHELRATEARRYTAHDTPIITGVHRRGDKWQGLWGAGTE